MMNNMKIKYRLCNNQLFDLKQKNYFVVWEVKSGEISVLSRKNREKNEDNSLAFFAVQLTN